jgi:hypothetical protein
MGAIMALLPSQFKETAKSLGVALLTTVFMAANANAAPNTPIELTCHTTPGAIAAAQEHIVKTVGMLPVVSRFVNVGTDDNAKWAMGTLMMHPESKRGVNWVRFPEGHVCTTRSYSNIQLFNNASFDPQAFADLKVFPRADDKGQGTDFSTAGVNSILIARKMDNQNPMYRANVDAMLNLTGKPLNTPTKYVEYLVGNPTTKEGTILGANLNGRMISEYYGVVGTPAKDSVKFGAVYTSLAEDILGIKSGVRIASLEKR